MQRAPVLLFLSVVGRASSLSGDADGWRDMCCLSGGMISSPKYALSSATGTGKARAGSRSSLAALQTTFRSRCDGEDSNEGAGRNSSSPLPRRQPPRNPRPSPLPYSAAGSASDGTHPRHAHRTCAISVLRATSRLSSLVPRPAASVRGGTACCPPSLPVRCFGQSGLCFPRSGHVGRSDACVKVACVVRPLPAPSSAEAAETSATGEEPPCQMSSSTSHGERRKGSWIFLGAVEGR